MIVIPRHLLAAALLVGVPLALEAQDEKPCTLVFTGVVRGGAVTTHMTAFTTGTGGRNTFIGGGVDATCEGQGNRLLADSAEHYAERGELILIARVRYSEPRMTMRSERMIYYTLEDRLLATGTVRGRSSSGTRFEGPQIEYFRAKPGLRTVPSWRAPGRPFVRMGPAATGQSVARAPSGATVPGDSMDLWADLVISENDSLVWASGNVVIERVDLRATADSATLDQGREFARLMRKPVIIGRGERSFTLVGTVVDLWSRNRKLERVRADGAAKVTSDSLTLTGDTIDLRLSAQRIERVFAWGTRATADAPEQRLEADSLDIRMPGQRLQQVHALGRAIALSIVDTQRILTEERDWIAGDTIVASFDTVLTADSSGGARMREVVATGTARAFYQLAPSSGERGAPNLSYNRGRVITVNFEGGAVRDVAVQEKASGIFLEPLPVDTTRKSGTPKPAASTPAAAKPAAAKPVVRRP